MARHRIKVPAAGQSIEEMTILEWHVGLGGLVSKGDDLVTVEADKVDLVIPCPVDGTIVEVLAQPEDQVAPGDQLCVVESGR